jgi:hypothetical protein
METEEDAALKAALAMSMTEGGAGAAAGAAAGDTKTVELAGVGMPPQVVSHLCFFLETRIPTQNCSVTCVVK